MDRIEAMRLFVRIVERRSFSAAAADLGLPRSTATQGIKELEARLGARLLQRTTRQVRPSLDGESYYQQCLSILADIDEAEASFRGAEPKGLIRVDVHGSLARHFVFPGLPLFLKTYPRIELHLSETGRSVDLVRDGVDCALTSGPLSDSSAIGRQVALLSVGTFASPDYLDRFGVPSQPDKLQGHRSIGFTGGGSGAIPLRFMVGGKLVRPILSSTAIVTSPESNVALGRLGLGLIQVPRYRVIDDLAVGVLTEVLPEYLPPPLPVHVVYAQKRHVPARLRVVIDWMAAEFDRLLLEQPQCSAASSPRTPASASWQ